MITLEHVYIEYTKTKIALRDINIHVDKGEFVFIGPVRSREINIYQDADA